MLFYRISIFINFNGRKFVELYLINNQECRIRPQIVNINSEESIFFFPFSIETSKSSSSCNNVNNLYAKLCVPDVVKSFYVKVLNLMS